MIEEFVERLWRQLGAVLKAFGCNYVGDNYLCEWYGVRFAVYGRHDMNGNYEVVVGNTDDGYDYEFVIKVYNDRHLPMYYIGEFGDGVFSVKRLQALMTLASIVNRVVSRVRREFARREGV